MKNSIYTLLLSVFCIFQLSSQVYVKPRSIGDFNPQSCNNSVIIETYNIPSDGWIQLSNQSGDNLMTLESLDTVNNFCFFDYYHNLTRQVHYFSSNGYFSHFRAFSTLIPPHLNYSIGNYSEPSSLGIGDGSFTLTFDSSVVISDYIITYSNNSTEGPEIIQIDANSLQLSNIYSGYIDINISNPINQYDYARFRLLFEDPQNIYINTGLTVNRSVQHTDGSGTCNGWIYLSPQNLTGNIYNTWSDNIYNQTLRVNLCEGVYSAYSYDQFNGEIVAGSIDTIVIVNNNTAYIDSNIFVFTPQDTVYYNFDNCDFDFLAPIDSVQYYEDTIYNGQGLTIIVYSLLTFQSNNVITLSDSLFLYNDSIITLDVALYCDQFRSNFMGQRIVILRGVDDHNFFQNGLGIDTKIHESIFIFPNPSIEYINIENIKDFQTIKVYDMFGHLIETLINTGHDKIMIPVNTMKNGMYIIELENSESIVRKTFIVSH